LPADDLCLRAARLLQAESGTALGADIHIDKQLPWGAGLGGGSSDAATVLLALNRLWGLHWPRSRLCSLGARIGADVPFFVGGHNAFVQGIGEILTPLPADVLPAQAFAVVKPGASLPTAAIFSSEKLTRDTKSVIVMGSRAGNAAQAASDGLMSNVAFKDFAASAQALNEWHSGFGRNDLQPAAEAVCTEVTQVARWLEQRFGNSRMTGSGSAVFARVGMEACPGHQPQATSPLAAMPAAWTGRMCRGLLIHPLAGWVAD
jgi:4-diphosphocytidyl-2-C-methyl-D-erythritol kinase